MSEVTLYRHPDRDYSREGLVETIAQTGPSMHDILPDARRGAFMNESGEAVIDAEGERVRSGQ